ncbi:MAG: DUF2063 domain-containing protein [Pseudomonadales bacterium]
MSLSLAQTHSLQTQLTDHIRDPGANAPPPGIEDRRLKIYRDLFYNNIEGFMRRGFPVTRSLFSDNEWHTLIRGFMQDFACSTPYFPEVTHELVTYLQSDRVPQANEPPFLTELVHYEWVEIALDLADIDLASITHERSGDLLSGRPLVSPLVLCLAYQYPVHEIGPGFEPDAPPEEATFLIVYRNRDDQVKFMHSNQVTLRMLALIAENDAATGREVLLKLATEMQHNDPQQLVASGQITLDKLRRLDIILGTH